MLVCATMEYSHEGYCARQGKATCAFCFGLILVPITMGVIFWNENDEVVNYATAELVYGSHELSECNPSSGSNGDLVFAACGVSAPDIAGQLPQQLSQFLPSYQGSSITWSTQIRQWAQTSSETCKKDNHGGKNCITTYSCSLGWQSGAVDSSNFKCNQAGRNINDNHGYPAGFSASQSYQAPEHSVKLGGSTQAKSEYALVLDTNLQLQLPSEDLSSKLGSGPGRSSTYGRFGGVLDATMLSRSGGYLTTGDQLGDVRISMTGRSATQATVAAQISHGGALYYGLGPFPSQTFGWFGKHTKPLEKLEPGLLSQSAFVKLWSSEIAAQAWLIRFVTFIVMIIAFEMIVQPLAVAADLLRMLNWCTCCLGTLLDDLAQCVIHTIAFCSAVILWLLTFSVAWIVARPLLGICLLAVDIAAIVLLVRYARGRKSARQVEPLMDGYPAAADSMGQWPNGGPHAQAPRGISMPVAARPVAPSGPAASQMSVTCPGGVGPGGLVSITTPSGQQMTVAVPAGVSPGQVFTVQIPA